MLCVLAQSSLVCVVLSFQAPCCVVCCVVCCSPVVCIVCCLECSSLLLCTVPSVLYSVFCVLAQWLVRYKPTARQIGTKTTLYQLLSPPPLQNKHPHEWWKPFSPQPSPHLPVNIRIWSHVWHQLRERAILSPIYSFFTLLFRLLFTDVPVEFRLAGKHVFELWIPTFISAILISKNVNRTRCSTEFRWTSVVQSSTERWVVPY